MARLVGSENKLEGRRVRADSRPKVAYYYDTDVGSFYYGPGHPMKPYRIRMANSLIQNYGLFSKMEVYRPRKATTKDMTRFHSDDYIEFLQQVRPDNTSLHSSRIKTFNLVDDCPVFDGLFDFSQLSAGGSLAAAVKLNKKECDIAINWSGGLHHAKKSSADGFCYVNDIVIAILELLKYHDRVLYIDIDIHHGDGVEEAFFATDRVMTLSFHKFHSHFFPGTGHINDIGFDKGRYYSANFPLRDGIDDESYKSIFEPLVEKVMQCYRPDVVVLQCGADSLTADLLGCFNLTLKGHAECVEYVKTFKKPMLLLGGGGYTIRNVARCWTLETACVLDEELSNALPYNDYFEYYAPDFKLHVSASNQPNDNDSRSLDRKLATLLEYIQQTICAPSVPFDELEPDAMNIEETDAEHADEADPDERIPQFRQDKIIERIGDFLDRAEGGEYSGARNRGRVSINTPSYYGRSTEKTSTANGANAASGTPSKSLGKRIKTEQSSGSVAATRRSDDSVTIIDVDSS